MLLEFAARFFHQRLELRAFRSQPALERPRALAQFAGDVLQSRPFAREKFLHNSIRGPINYYLKFSRRAFGRHPCRLVPSGLQKIIHARGQPSSQLSV